MKRFNKAIMNLASECIEGIKRSTYVQNQKKYIDWSRTSEEEATALMERINCEAAYLKGFVDGIRLSKMV